MRYDFLITEGYLKYILARIEQRQLADGRAYCLQIHLEPGVHTLEAMRNTLEPLGQMPVAAIDDYIATEGYLRSRLSDLEQKRLEDGRPYCMQLHIEPGVHSLKVVRMTIEPLSQEMLAQMRAKGQLDFS